MTRPFLLSQIVIMIAVGILSLLYNNTQQLFSLFVGLVLATVNTGALLWGWTRIMAQNSFALTGLGIVFKYAFLGIVLYIAVIRLKVDTLFFLIGLSTFIPSLMVAGFFKSRADLKTRRQ